MSAAYSIDRIILFSILKELHANFIDKHQKMNTQEIISVTRERKQWAFLTGKNQWENWLYGEAWIADNGVLKFMEWKNRLEKKNPKIKTKKPTPDALAEIDLTSSPP